MDKELICVVGGKEVTSLSQMASALSQLHLLDGASPTSRDTCQGLGLTASSATSTSPALSLRLSSQGAEVCCVSERACRTHFQARTGVDHHQTGAQYGGTATL